MYYGCYCDHLGYSKQRQPQSSVSTSWTSRTRWTTSMGCIGVAEEHDVDTGLGNSCLGHMMKIKCASCRGIEGGGDAIGGGGVFGRLQGEGTGNEGAMSRVSLGDKEKGKEICNINQKHVGGAHLREHQLAARIVELQSKYSGCCGWCLAKGGVKMMHCENLCQGGLKNACYSCKVNSHGTKQCVVRRLSKVIQGNYTRNICFRWGLSSGAHNKYDFHRKQKTDGECGSGMMSTPEQFCWYLFHHSKEVVQKYVGDSKKTANEFGEWLGGKGGPYYYNMYIMFCEMSTIMKL
ncbi:hypothetical protein VP01_2404g2 [Puccinia sorghi]|uniref:Uncharacterized protein n=1 Tax=Puccinia sorghi TaxID=27349 RepID=A0A0L6V6P8_9BASI|nr:hypothetical protein VP01_2404g2 [Puccinia sorghi]